MKTHYWCISKVLARIQPIQGTAAVFRDTLWHDGEELIAGEKYLLRTDVIYEREVPFDFEAMYRNLDNDGKRIKALLLAEALEDAGNGEEAIKWYKMAMRLESTGNWSQYLFLYTRRVARATCKVPMVVREGLVNKKVYFDPPSTPFLETTNVHLPYRWAWVVIYVPQSCDRPRGV